MGKVRHFLFLMYSNFKWPFCYCCTISIIMVCFVNFCCTQYYEINQRLEYLKEIDYSNIYKVTFALSKEKDYIEIRDTLKEQLKTSAIVLNYARNPLYTTKDNNVIPIRVISEEENRIFHIFDQRKRQEDFYLAIVSEDLKNEFRLDSSYMLPMGKYVNETDLKIEINVVRADSDFLVLSSLYRNVVRTRNEILIFDPHSTLPIHIQPRIKPVFEMFIYINNLEETIECLHNYNNFIKIEKTQDSVDNFSNIKMTLLPSYFKFMFLGICMYILAYINLYLLFYYKKKSNITIFIYYNFNRRFYLLCIAILNIIEFSLGFTIGQILWFCYCKFSGTIYIHSEVCLAVLLALIHLGIFIFLRRGYSYITTRITRRNS